MPKRPHRRLSAAILLAACSTAFGVDNANLPNATQELLQMYPGTHIAQDQGRIQTIYGMPMTAGLTPRDAATLWIQLHGEAFGVGPLTVDDLWTTPIMDGRFTVFSYRQNINGIPVEHGNLRVLVLNEPIPRVVYAAGTLAPQPKEVQARVALDGNTALAIAQAQFSAKGMNTWKAPEKVIWQGDGTWIAPVVAWHISGYSSNPNDKLSRSYYINASTARVVLDRDDITHTDVNGVVQGWATPGFLPDMATNPPVLMNIPEVRATITGGNSAFTGLNGAYTIVNPGTSPVTVTSGTGGSFGGRWVTVNPVSLGPVVTASVGVTPPGPANIVLNAAPSQGLTAQMNALICTDITHNYIKDRAPAWTGLDIVLPANTGVSGTCNAFFDPGALTINFYNVGGGCNNTSYSNVISHEYGHFIVNRLGLAQGAFGEGFGDSCAMLIWDDNIIGRFFQTNGGIVRDPVAANIQYPCDASCGGAVHCCGQQVGALWWRIRTNFGTQYGSAPGLDQTRTRHVAWSQITVGGSGTNGIHPTTAIEVLTVDDNDGNINNGTPNRNLICPAFALGGITCPALSLISFQYPSGHPTQITPGVPTNFAVNVVPNSGTPQPGTGTVSYRIGGGSYTTVAMAQGSPNQYTATLPAVGCAQSIDYYFSAGAVGGGTQTDPSNAPTTAFNAIANIGATTTTIADFNFNADPGWTQTLNGSGTMTTGQWDRGVPVAGSGGVIADFTGGGQCWVTDNRAGNFDLDGGPCTLTTTAFNLSAYAGSQVQFAKWFNSVNGAVDVMTFEYSINNGANWTVLATYPSAVGWSLQTINLPSLSSQTRFRWNINDQPNDSVTEAGIDAFKLTGIACGVACYADCDQVGGLTGNDFQCFLDKFVLGASYADCDGVGGLTGNDFQCFLDKFVAGCS